MKIHAVETNDRQKAFTVTAGVIRYRYPYARLDPAPRPDNPIASVAIDAELGREAFTCTLASGAEGSVHVEQVLDCNHDPGYLRDLLLYELTLEARRRVTGSPLSKRELIRRMSTSPRQFYRLLDQTCIGCGPAAKPSRPLYRLVSAAAAARRPRRPPSRCVGRSRGTGTCRRGRRSAACLTAPAPG